MKKYIEILLFATKKNIEENAGEENLNFDYFFCILLQEAKESLSKNEYKELCNLASILKTFAKGEWKETEGFNYLLRRALYGYFKLKENAFSKNKVLSFLGHEWKDAEEELNSSELNLYSTIVNYLITHY